VRQRIGMASIAKCWQVEIRRARVRRSSSKYWKIICRISGRASSECIGDQGTFFVGLSDWSSASPRLLGQQCKQAHTRTRRVVTICCLDMSLAFQSNGLLSDAPAEEGTHGTKLIAPPPPQFKSNGLLPPPPDASTRAETSLAFMSNGLLPCTCFFLLFDDDDI
jgi:hypothetical protein